jgi:hypothetical protein
MRAVLAGIGLLCGVWALAEAEGTLVSYPAEYRKWVHVKSTLVGPESANFAVSGGIHHNYANEKALART